MPELAKRNQCSGCTACVAVCPQGCISMKENRDGFCYPEIDRQKCVSCRLCEKTCPVLCDSPQFESEVTAFAALSKDKQIRMESSSGGLFTEIARTILNAGGVVFGTAYNEEFDVVHICVDNEADLSKLRGAKYSQSDLTGIFKEVKSKLDNNRRVLFAGTPCQVAGLRSFLQKDYEKLLLIDFVCHSVPSPMVWRSFLQQLSRDKQIETINLRSKATGWSHYQYSHFVEYSDGEHLEIRNQDSLYMKLFVNGYISRESCSDCRFKGYQRLSDLTLGDFWGIWDIDAEMDDNMGTSVVLIQSHKGLLALEQINDSVKLKQVTLEEASRCNPAILFSARHSKDREKVLKTINAEGFLSIQKLFVDRNPSLFTRAKNLISRLVK